MLRVGCAEDDHKILEINDEAPSECGWSLHIEILGPILFDRTIIPQELRQLKPFMMVLTDNGVHNIAEVHALNKEPLGKISFGEHGQLSVKRLGLYAKLD